MICRSHCVQFTQMLDSTRSWLSAADVIARSKCHSPIDVFFQIYFYATYVFKQAGIPQENIPYVTLGTGACECLTALTCVSDAFSFCHWAILFLMVDKRETWQALSISVLNRESAILSTGFTDWLHGEKISYHWRICRDDILVHCVNVLPDISGTKGSCYDTVSVCEVVRVGESGDLKLEMNIS